MSPIELWVFLNSPPVVLAFYIALFVFLYLFRHKFEFQAKIIAFYRTNIGIKQMQWLAKRMGGFIKLFAWWMVFPAFLLMIISSGYLVFNGVKLIQNPTGPSDIAIILPGVQVPGSPIALPLWHGLMALFIVIAIHEFSHGVVAVAHKLKITSTGFFFFGPIPGAFVEPDEKELKKSPKKVQEAIFAAGPMSNMVLGLLIIGFMLVTPTALSWAAGPAVDGISFNGIASGSGAEFAGLPANTTVTHVNGQEINTLTDFVEYLPPAEGKGLMPGDQVEMTLIDGRSVSIIAGDHPDHGNKTGFVGVTGMQLESKDNSWTLPLIGLLDIGGWLRELLFWIWMLSLGIGIVNLLPIGPVDGGRMLQLLLHHTMGEETGNDVWKKVSIVFVAILLFNLLLPMARELFRFLLPG